MKKIIVRLIKLYQASLSPDHGWFKHRHPYGFCKYYPSCSEYSSQAIEKHGVLRGALMSAWRVLRCNPFSSGGVDTIK